MRGTFLHSSITYHCCTQNNDKRTHYILIYCQPPRKFREPLYSLVATNILNSSFASLKTCSPLPTFDVHWRSFVGAAIICAIACSSRKFSSLVSTQEIQGRRMMVLDITLSGGHLFWNHPTSETMTRHFSLGRGCGLQVGKKMHST